MTASREPSEIEINQVEPEVYPPTEVPVKIEGPVNARILPSVAWTVARFNLSDAVGPVRVVNRNPMRRSVTLIPSTAGVLFGTSQEQVRTRAGAGLLPLTVQIVLTHTEEVWVGNVATETPDCTVVEEMWTN